MRPRATIVVVTHDAVDHLRRCLDSVFRHTPAGSWSLVVVDNASRDGTARYLAGLRRHPSRPLILRNARNRGFSAAANRAVGTLADPWAVFLDDDVRVSRGWLDGLLAEAARRPRAGVAGCKLLSPNGRIFSAEIIPFFRSEAFGEKDLGQRDYVRTCEAVCGACLAVRRDVFSMGLRFDERFFPCQEEDVDLCLQARRRGLQVLYDGAVGLLHDHLFRGRSAARENASLLRRKWRGACGAARTDSHPLDRGLLRIMEGLERGRLREIPALCRGLDGIHPVPGYLRYYAARAYAGMRSWRKADAEIAAALRSLPRVQPSARGILTLERERIRRRARRENAGAARP